MSNELLTLWYPIKDEEGYHSEPVQMPFYAVFHESNVIEIASIDEIDEELLTEADYAFEAMKLVIIDGAIFRRRKIYKRVGLIKRIQTFENYLLNLSYENRFERFEISDKETKYIEDESKEISFTLFRSLLSLHP